MTNKLFDIIARRIEQQGPMDLGEYMSLCLGHPEFGYYMTRDPFGATGDFVTAPEISQMFGEMVGAWVADTWDRLGRPSPFALVECGPGRGTLMADTLRITKNIPGFHDAVRLHLMEMSLVLREAQQRTLGEYDPVWMDDLTGIPDNMPIILIGNEFLDALPVRQVKYKNEWREVVVGLDDNDTLCAGEKTADQTLLDHLPASILSMKSEEVFECSPVINQFLNSMNILLQKQKGAALFIDYGHAVSAPGNTLQAVRKHRFENPFENPGLCDLTTHVDFENVQRLAKAQAVFATPVVTQGQFLETLGIETRAASLRAKASEAQKADIDAALARLVDDNQMGRLFKVVALCHDGDVQLAGFPSL